MLVIYIISSVGCLCDGDTLVRVPSRLGVCVKQKTVDCCDCCFFQAEDGIRDIVRSRGLGDVYKRQDDGLLRL